MLTRARTNPLVAALTSALAVASIVLAACSGSTPAAPSPTAAPPKAAATTPAPAATSTAAAATPSAAPAATTVKLAKVGTTESVLVDSRGMTLYIFKNDVAGNGKSVCNGGCATNWPALKAPESGAPTKAAGVTGDLSVVTRDDGSKQVAYKGLPLYFFAADQAVGDAKGAAIANWALALP